MLYFNYDIKPTKSPLFFLLIFPCFFVPTLHAQLPVSYPGADLWAAGKTGLTGTNPSSWVINPASLRSSPLVSVSTYNRFFLRELFTYGGLAVMPFPWGQAAGSVVYFGSSRYYYSVSSFGYAKAIAPAWQMGLKSQWRTFYNGRQTAHSLRFVWGTIFSKKKFRLAGVIVSPERSLIEVDGRHFLSWEFRLGISFFVYQRTRVAIDWVAPLQRKGEVRAGATYVFNEFIEVSLGYYSLPHAATSGLSLSWKGFRLHGAAILQGVLGWLPMVSLSYQWNKR